MPTVHERSYGVVPMAQRDGGISIFLVQRHDGSWQLPKGHAEKGESPRQAAERELQEETGFTIVKWIDYGIDHEPFVEQYSFMRDGRSVHKEVQYFPAIVEGEESLQPEEIKAGKWEQYENVPLVVTFPELQMLTTKVGIWIRSFHSTIPFLG